MKKVSSENLRNIAVVGHGQTGKTSLVSAILYNTGMVNRLGRVEEGNTVTDFNEEEIEKKISITSSVAYAVKDKIKINIIDTPGYANFIWEARIALRAVETAVMLVCAQEGVQVQTEKVFDSVKELDKPVIFVVNKMNRELADFSRALDSINDSFGKNAIAIHYPIGKGEDFKGIVDLISMKAFQYTGGDKGDFKEIELTPELKDEVNTSREELVEKIAENDEKLMEKYFEDGDLSIDDICSGMKQGIINKNIYPVLVTDAVANTGVNQVIDFVKDYAPSPVETGEIKTADGVIKPDPKGDFSGMVFKTISDPYTGKISILRVYSGVFKPDSSYYNNTKDTDERFGGLFYLQGKNQVTVGEVDAGDIVAVAKLKETRTGDSFSVKGKNIRFPEFKFPVASISFAIEPKSREDENKISIALKRIQEEDPTILSRRDPRTKELIISGNGQLHVEMVVGKLKKRYGVEVEMTPPKVPYCETIKGKSDIERKYKKQSGGRGQYAHIYIKMEPIARGKDFIFENTIFGGSIPKNYIPAVEKGIREAKETGVMAAYPVVDFKMNLYDGSFHEVDSSDMAFKICASQAFKQAMKEARPTLLEPIMQVEVVIPEENLGDINGNLSGRRGRIQGMEPKGRNQVVKALAPMSEMLDFEPNLTSITGGRGSYFMEFSHYEEVPGNLQQKVIEEAKRDGRIRDEEE